MNTKLLNSLLRRNRTMMLKKPVLIRTRPIRRSVTPTMPREKSYVNKSRMPRTPVMKPSASRNSCR